MLRRLKILSLRCRRGKKHGWKLNALKKSKSCTQLLCTIYMLIPVNPSHCLILVICIPPFLGMSTHYCWAPAAHTIIKDTGGADHYLKFVGNLNNQVLYEKESKGNKSPSHSQKWVRPKADLSLFFSNLHISVPNIIVAALLTRLQFFKLNPYFTGFFHPKRAKCFICTAKTGEQSGTKSVFRNA